MANDDVIANRSPNDPIESLQFTVEEMAAAVQEARSMKLPNKTKIST